MKEIKLVGEIEDFPIKNAPELIVNKLNVVGNVELSQDEIKCFNHALVLLSIQLQKENINISNLHSVNILFLSDGNFSIQNTRNGFAGCTTSVIIYVMNVIRSWNDANKVIAVFLEELAHHFWNIEDESIVKHKVLEIMRNININLNMEDIYDNGQKYM